MSLKPCLAILMAPALLSGCAILSVSPTIELVKMTGAMMADAIATGPSRAKNSVYHPHAPIDAVCVEYNPLTPDPEIAPVLQAELKVHQIESRVYEADAMPASCHFRLSYTASIDWAIPPMAPGYKAYLRDATLTLRDDGGTVLSSSAYSLDGPLQVGKWAPHRSKIAPMVTQLVTGFDH